MAKQKQTNGDHNVLPETLAALVQKAKLGACPTITQEEENAIPLLWGFMLPQWLPDPKYKGKGDAPRVLREPLLLASWDRRQAGWKAILSDNTLAVGGGIVVGSLLTLAVDLEAAMREDKIVWTEKITR